MAIDLLLDLDDELLGLIDRRAEASGIGRDELVRGVLYEAAGMPHQPVDPETLHLMRPMAHLDLRR